LEKSLNSLIRDTSKCAKFLAQQAYYSVEGALWLYPKSFSNVLIAIGCLKPNRLTACILPIHLKNRYLEAFIATLSNKNLFAETQNAKNPFLFIGTRQWTTSTEYEKPKRNEQMIKRRNTSVGNVG